MSAKIGIFSTLLGIDHLYYRDDIFLKVGFYQIFWIFHAAIDPGHLHLSEYGA